MRLLNDFIVPSERIPRVPHPDQKRICGNAAEIQAALSRVVPASVVEFRRHGNATIPAQTLVSLAMITWGWLSGGTIEDRLQVACQILTGIRETSGTLSRQGLMKALASGAESLLPLMIRHMADLVQGIKGLWSARGKVNIAADGTKFLAPRTVANQAAFSAEKAAAKKTGRPRRYATEADRAKAATVQVNATVMWHLGSGLPLNWRLGGSASSERRNVIEMLPELPANARLVGDAEFVGDPLWRALIDSRRSFIVRVGSNVKLLKNLGELQFSEGYVYFWTDKSQRKSQPPLVLRLITIHNGKHPIYLITNDLEIEDEEVRTIYRQRWGIEDFFRTVKQSAQRRKLSCLTPTNVLTELQWTLLGLWAALFLGQESFRAGQLPRERLSPVKILRALSRVLHSLRDQATTCPPLRELLQTALKADESTRDSPKHNRHYPHKKRHQPAGPPILKSATPAQKRLAKKLLP